MSGDDSGPGRDGSLRTLAKGFALASFIGVPFAVLVSCGALAGHALDKRVGTSPWLLLGGLVLGAVAAFLNMMRVLRKLQSLDETWEQRRAQRTTGRAGDDDTR